MEDLQTLSGSDGLKICSGLLIKYNLFGCHKIKLRTSQADASAFAVHLIKNLNGSDGFYSRQMGISMRVSSLVTLLLALYCSSALAQGYTLSSHPDGDTPLARMVALAHTEALPNCDKIELFALDSNLRSVKGAEIPKDQAFPIRPYHVNAKILESVTLTGDSVQSISKAWRAMTFDKFGGAFCHEPVYGIRFFRDDKILFETSVCWKCSNFYMPDVEQQTSATGAKDEPAYQWYGFKANAASKGLLSLLRKHLPHPQLK